MTYTTIQRDFLSWTLSRPEAFDLLIQQGLRPTDCNLLLNAWTTSRRPLSVLHLEDLDPLKEDAITHASNLPKE